MRFSFGNLRFRLFVLVILALGPAIGLILYSAIEQRGAAMLRVQEEAQRLTRLLSVNQERYIEGARQLLVGLSKLPAVRGADQAACTALFSELVEEYPQYINFALAEINGDVLCSGLPQPGPVNIADRAYERIANRPGHLGSRWRRNS